MNIDVNDIVRDIKKLPKNFQSPIQKKPMEAG